MHSGAAWPSTSGADCAPPGSRRPSSAIRRVSVPGVSGTPIHLASVPGVWKEKTRRLRGSGSSLLVNCVSAPVPLVQERERPLVGRKIVGQSSAVLLGLDLDAR